MLTPSQVDFADVAEVETIPEASSVRKRQTRTAGRTESLALYLTAPFFYWAGPGGPAPKKIKNVCLHATAVF